jgi:hypothetical protein
MPKNVRLDVGFDSEQESQKLVVALCPSLVVLLEVLFIRVYERRPVRILACGSATEVAPVGKR